MPRLPRLTVLLLLALTASAAAKAPETVNIGYQKANIFALLPLDSAPSTRASISTR